MSCLTVLIFVMMTSAYSVSGQRFDLSSLSLRAAAKSGGFSCPDKDTHFELVGLVMYTGWARSHAPFCFPRLIASV